MRPVIDINVFISGVFYSGPRYNILDDWRQGTGALVFSPEIRTEYHETGEELGANFPDADFTLWIEFLAAVAKLIEAPPLLVQICADPDDGKFLACALADRSKLVVSGDKALPATSGYRGIEVLTPRQFIDKHLRKRTTQ